jgi:ATP-dependent Clp protease ATP-binding subunit ClpB
MKQKGDSYMSTAALLTGLFQTKAGIIQKLSSAFNLTAANIAYAEDDRRKGITMDSAGNEGQLDALKKYGHDIVQDVKDGRIDPVIGLDDEIRRVIEILSRKTKNITVLIGEPGVGKTAIVEGLAWRIMKGDVPLALKDKKLIESAANRFPNIQNQAQFDALFSLCYNCGGGIASGGNRIYERPYFGFESSSCAS